jgi:hypothetical protein
MLIYFRAIWNILQIFRIFYDHLVHFFRFWYHLATSGNPGTVCMYAFCHSLTSVPKLTNCFKFLESLSWKLLPKISPEKKWTLTFNDRKLDRKFSLFLSSSLFNFNCYFKVGKELTTVTVTYNIRFMYKSFSRNTSAPFKWHFTNTYTQSVLWVNWFGITSQLVRTFCQSR